MQSPRYAVYILANARPTLYVGVTGRLDQRLAEHRSDARPDSFVGRYRLRKLVYVEYFQDIWEAIARESELKGWSRERKLALIRSRNPTLRDLMPPAPRPDRRTPPPPWEQRRHRW